MWREDLKLAADYYSADAPKVDPVFLWSVNPPSATKWPQDFPSCPSLLDFYAICDGGYFGPMISFHRKADLYPETYKWIETLRDYDDGAGVLTKGQHAVIASDADGAPWVFDSVNGTVQCFYWKSGEWCQPRYDSHDAFLDQVFYKDSNSEDWLKALTIIRQNGG